MATTDLEAHVNAKGRDELVEAGSREDQRAWHYLYLLSVHLGHRADRRQGHPGGPLGAHGGEGLSARLRLDRQPVHRPARRLYRLRPGGLGAGRHSRSRDVRAAALGQAHRPRILHLLSQPRGGRESRRPSDLGLPRQSSHPSTRSSRRSTACICAPAPSRR